ncbi:MAG: hypothetical protein HQL31_07350, partial [Planctomycetes bacterium]|nr:hypothetical protein [Planctomycetota bacterium]
MRRNLALDAVDRVPINYSANPDIHGRLMEHFRLEAGEDERLLDMLGVDFRSIGAPYIGRKIHPDKGDIKVSDWGIHTRWVEHGQGGYWDYCSFPLIDADEETIAAWPMPNPDDFDYSAVRGMCEKYRNYGLGLGGPGLGDIINTNGMLRGTEQSLIDLITQNPAGRLL